ncbi:hypothetical protein CWE22_02670 [Pseudidiomarina aestuarii]|uniref:Stress protein n=1 Tax=Pseudidiomarina aestuarii TaxID=624146 RepID=A0A7Z7ETK3_9GAMM|nr:hypothetical protein [Pseudidiomarina aestuarii]RUO41110.1 hypothetical protein CWE22_02670 [Pseudidiomarina aestuarii]
MSDDKLVKRQGNFSRALRGEEPLVIGEVLQRAWEITVRSLPVMLPLMIAYIVIAMVLNSLFLTIPEGMTMFDVMLDPELKSDNDWTGIVTQIILAPLWGGLTLIGILNANDEKITFSAAFSVLQRSIPVMAVTFVKLALPALITFLAFVSIGLFSPPAAGAVSLIALIIINITFMLAIPLVVHRQTSVFKSIMGSVLVLRRYFWRALGLMIIMVIIIIISALPLLLGLLFTLPLLFNVTGVLYIALLGDRDTQEAEPVFAEEQVEASSPINKDTPNE